MRFAYADPPYIGQAKRHYRDGGTARRKLERDPEACEVDHAQLIARIVDEYPDGWALSASSPSLSKILAQCPKDVRVGAWVKPFAVFKPNVNPAYAWEPIVFRGGRRRERSEPTVRDWISCNVELRKGLVGAKPEDVCRWLLAILNVRPGDAVDDLFPGTGVFGRIAAQVLAGAAA